MTVMGGFIKSNLYGFLPNHSANACENTLWPSLFVDPADFIDWVDDFLVTTLLVRTVSNGSTDFVFLIAFASDRTFATFLFRT